MSANAILTGRERAHRRVDAAGPHADLEQALGDPFDAANPLGYARILDADEREALSPTRRPCSNGGA